MNTKQMAAILATCVLISGVHSMASAAISLSSEDGPLQGLMHSHKRSADRLRAAFDANHDGKVTREELDRVEAGRFIAGSRNTGFMTEQEFASADFRQTKEHAIQIFNRLDWNGDGRLTLEEYSAPCALRSGRRCVKPRPGLRGLSRLPQTQLWSLAILRPL